MPTIDNLVLEIQSNSATAEQGLNSLAKALEGLRVAASNQRGLNAVAKGIRSIADASNSLSVTGVQSLNEMTNALRNIGALNSVKLSTSFASQIRAIGNATRSLSGTDWSQVGNLANNLAPLSGIEKATNLNNVVNTLRKLPSAIDGINNIDSSKIAEFTKRIEELRVAIRPLADEMRAVSAGFSALPKNIQKAINANEKLTSSNVRATRGFFSLHGKIAKIIAAYYTLRKVFRLAMDAFKKSNEYIEALNLAEITLGKNAEAAKAYAEQVERLAGINQVEWLTNVGTLNQMLTGFGVGSDAAANMSQQLTQLAYDIQSAYNAADISDVMRRIQSGITGEVEGMRRYGVELSNAAMQEYMLANGINAKVSSLSMAEKSMVRYHMIMTKTSAIQGDLARTIATPANALRILSSQASIAGRYLGQLVSIIAMAVIPIMQAVTRAIAMAAQALASLFGYSLPSIGAGTDSVSGSLDGISNAVDGVGGSASEAAKEVKGLLASFDEINVIQQKTSDVGSGGAGGSGVGNLDWLSGYQYDFLAGLTEDENSLFNHLLELAQSGKWYELGYAIQESMISAIEKIDAVGIGMMIGKAVTSAIDFALGFLQNAPRAIWEIGAKIGQWAMGAILSIDWTKVVTFIGVAIGSSFLGLPLTLMAIFSQIDWVYVGVELVNCIISGLTNSFKWLFDSMTELIKSQDWESMGQQIAKSFFTFDFSSFTKDLDIEGLVSSVSDFLTTLYTTVTSLSDEAYLGLATFVAIGGALIGLFTGNWIPLLVGSVALVGPKIIEMIQPAIDWFNETALPAISGWWDSIKAAWNSTGEWLELPIEAKIQSIIAWWNETAGPAISSWWSGVIEPWTLFVDWINNKFVTPISEFFSSLGTNIGTSMDSAASGIQTAWGAIGEWFKTTVCEPVVTFFQNMVNGVIDAINAAIGFLNGLSVTFPSWSIDLPDFSKFPPSMKTYTVGGNTIDFFNIPTIPRIGEYANGGFPPDGQLFIANETGAGPELIGQIGNKTAVANSAQIIQGISSGVARANTSLEQKVDRLTRVVEAILSKEFTAEVRPSAALGKTVKRSMEMQARVGG